jgi:hypothetical protein
MGAGRSVASAIAEIEVALVPAPANKSPPPTTSDDPAEGKPKAQSSTKAELEVSPALVSETNAKPTLPGADATQQRAALLDMKLSDVWLTAMARDPKGAGRSFSDAIGEIEAALVRGPTNKSRGLTASDAPPRTQPEGQPAMKSEPAVELLPDQSPRAAE